MNTNKKVSFSTAVFSQTVDDEIVLLDMASENYFGLNTVGSDIWQLLQQGKTLQETKDSLLEMYDVESNELENDLLDFVEVLKEKNLITGR